MFVAGQPYIFTSVIISDFDSLRLDQEQTEKSFGFSFIQSKEKDRHNKSHSVYLRNTSHQEMTFHQICWSGLKSEWKRLSRCAWEKRVIREKLINGDGGANKRHVAFVTSQSIID